MIVCDKCDRKEAARVRLVISLGQRGVSEEGESLPIFENLDLCQSCSDSFKREVKDWKNPPRAAEKR